MRNYTFILLIIITILLSLLSKELLNTNDLVISSLAEQLTNEQISEVVGVQKKWEWLGFIIIPIILLLKTSVIAAIIDAGCFFFDKEIKYKKIFGIVAKAEFIFLGVIIFKILWFYLFQQDYTLEDLQYFYPLSAINITGYDGLDAWWVYPLQAFNLFELTYWFILAYLLGKELDTNLDKGLSIVASSYGVALVIWIIGIMFFTLNMS